MRLFLSVSVLCTLSLGIAVPAAFAQKEISDSVELSEEGRNAKTDEIFFEAVKAKMHNDDSGVVKLFSQFAALRPEVSDADYELAKYYYSKKNKDKAEEYIKKAIALDDGNKWYKEQYASILADRGDFTDAAVIMSGLNVKYPDDQVYPLMAAEYYEQAHEYGQAIPFLDKAITQVGADDDIMLRKAQLYINMKETDKAAAVMEQMIANDPKEGKNYELLGELYDNNKEPDKAAKVFEKALKAIPEDPYVQRGLVEHYLKTGDSASFILYVKKVVLNKQLDVETQLDFLKTYVQSLPNDSALVSVQILPIMAQLVAQHPDDPEVLGFYGAILETINNYDAAAAEFKQALAIKPSDYEAWISVLQLYSSRQNGDSLLKYSEKALRLFPNQGNFHFYNGVAHFYKKDYPAAISALNRAVDMEPDSDKVALSAIYSYLGDIYHANKQDELSDKAFDNSLGLVPDNAYLLNNYSFYLSERGVKLDLAEKMSQKSMDLLPGEATFMDTYGWILYKKGKYEKAKEYIQKAIKLSGTKVDAILYDHLGNVYFKLNDKDKAIENWKAAKEKGDPDELIDKKINEGKLYE